MSKAPPPLIPVSNGMRPDNLSSHKGVGRNGLDKQRLADTPAFRPDPTRQEPPYKVRKVRFPPEQENIQGSLGLGEQ